MTEVLDRKRDAPAAGALGTKIIRLGTGQDPVREAPAELGIVDEQAFERMIDPAKTVKPCIAQTDRNPEPPLLVVALTFAAALASLVASLFWPYLMLFVTTRG